MSRQRGFTLIETLVALAVAAIALLALTQAGAQFVRAQEALQTRFQAAAVAENEIMRLHGGELKRLVDGRTVTYGGRRWRVSYRREKTVVPGMVRLTVEVMPARGRHVLWRSETVLAP